LNIDQPGLSTYQNLFKYNIFHIVLVGQ
jgi:hypothetical protein